VPSGYIPSSFPSRINSRCRDAAYAAAMGTCLAVLVDVFRPIILAVIDAKKFEQEYGFDGRHAPPPKREQSSI
jgi:hypothetical protein